MKTNCLQKGKLVLAIFFTLMYPWPTVVGQFNLDKTSRKVQSNLLQFDCLNYHVRRKTRAYQDSFDVVDEVIPYCFRPANDSNQSLEPFDKTLHRRVFFEELRLGNISAQKLVSWSVAMEVIEQYQAYIDAPNVVLNEYFYNCTPPRFGLRCQYSFPFGQGPSFNEIVEVAFTGREAYPESSNIIVEVPCYVLLKCHRNGQPWCLDWREICDGVIDCFDEGTDERLCFDLEINECSDDEFRCHNGLCISQEFWEDGKGEADCLDRSDAAREDRLFIKSCFQNPTFVCEEHSCRIDVNPFSCGDGQCVVKFDSCSNGRHRLLLSRIVVQGNLTNQCWNAMMCLTRFVKNVNGTSCEIWL